MAEAAPQLTQDFRDFLIEAKQHGYGTPGADVRMLESGAKQIWYRRDPFLYIDSFAGGNPYGGFEHVSGQVEDGYMPIWSMSYFETVLRGMIDKDVVAVLSQVLPQPDAELPIRGPRKWEQGDPAGTHYLLKPVNRGSSLEAFDAEEFIFRDGGREKYVARFMGGLINRDNLAVVTNQYWLVNG